MNQGDIQRIELELEVSLPKDYQAILLHYPIRYAAGTATEPIWDDAETLIERNLELRKDRKSLGVEYKALPSNYLFIGDDGAGWQNLIDLNAAEPTAVFTMEYEDVESIHPAKSAAGNEVPIAEWFHDYLVELKNGGIDPTSEEPPSAGSWGCLVIVLGFCLAVAALITVVIVIVESISAK